VAARQQQVRLHFMIALTLAVMVFGAARFVRTYRQRQLRTASVRAAQELHRFVRPEEDKLQDLAMTARGSLAPDAAALLMQARYLIEKDLEEPSAASSRRTSAALARIRANLERLRAGEPAAFPRGQSFLRAYYAELDGTFQPYSVCVPDAYLGDYAYPVIVNLHGLQGFGRYQCVGAPCYQGALCVKPEGRGATDYMYVGEDDVVAVLEQVRQLYSIDPRRVYLVGNSMGATGCWNLAVHYPHLFAGIVPVSGNADYRAWEQRWGWNAAAPDAHEDLRAFLHASLSPASYAENLAHCRIVAVHGTGDQVVPVEHARNMASRLRELGYPIEYLEFPQAAHRGFPGWVKDYAVAKVFGQPPEPTPARFRYKTASLRHNRAWWVTLDALDHPARFAQVTADLAEGCARLTTDNVSALTVHADEAPAEVRAVRVDGREFALPASGEGASLSLEKYGAVWREPEPRGLRKRRGLSGPVSDTLRDPFLVVYGTVGGGELHGRLSRAEAMRFAGEWEMRYGERPRMKADAEVSAKDMAELNLLVFGGPAVNLLARRVAPRMPVTVQRDAVRVGGTEYRGEDVGVIVCHPNPLNPRRMVALVAGTTPAALYQAWDRFGLWFNWGAYDKYKWFDYAVFDRRTAGPESFLAVGFFDNEWQLAPEGGVLGGGAQWEAEPSARARLLPQGFPAMGSAAESEERSVALSDVRPVDMQQYRGAVGFNRSYTGGPISLGGQTFPKGLGVKAPSKLSFALGGKFRRFNATVGLTEGFHTSVSAARADAEEVVFEVWGDGRLLAAARPLNWREQGRSTADLTADVSEVSLLTLTVRPTGGRTWLYGACAWADPVLTR